MGEKKTIKISISTFLLIITIVVICIMGYFIYKINSDKTLLSQNNSNLNNEISSLKIEIENANDKIKTISNTINSSNNTNTELAGTTQVATTTTTHPELKESEALIIATNAYKNAYNMFYSEQVMISGNYTINGEKKFGYKVNINELEKVFSKRAIQLIKKQLIEYNGEYYDIEGKFFETLDPSSIFSGTDAENRDLTIVDYTDKYIIATGKLLSGEHIYGDKVPLYIIFIKENDKWLIEIYE